MNEKNSELQKNAISNKYFLSSNMSKFWGVKRFIAMLAVCILLIACISMLGFNLSANNFVYAEEDTQTTSSDEDADEAALRGTAINSDWQFVDDVPVLQDVPQDANILYELHDMQGTIVQKSDIVDEQKYLVTATLTGDSAKSYYFAETGANSVSMFFENSTEISTLSVVADNQISALWALLILGLAIIGIAVAVVRIIVNIHENSQEKEEQKHNQKTCAFGGVALLAFLGLDVKVWMILAFVAVALFFIGVIIMLLTWRRHGHNMVAHVTTTPTNIYVTNSYNYLAAAAVEDEEEEVVEEKRRRNPSNFRVRLKASSDKCKDFYVQLKNFISGYRQIRFRMAGNIEKVMYQDQVLAFIGTTKRSLKLWLSLNPEYYDVEVYHHKDVSDKKRYEQVPMLVKVGSGRALARAEELFKTILAKHDVEQKIRHTDRDLQLLAYTLGRNALVKDKRAELLRMAVHVHDASDAITNADAERYTETRTIAELEERNFATINLDALDGKFLDGQRVSLAKLKKKELVPEDCNGVRIIAGTRLSKPLYIVADDYSLDAVKMIVLTGGRAIKLIEEKQN